MKRESVLGLGLGKSVRPDQTSHHSGLMERTQRNAARFITGDYRSTTPGSVTRPLKKTNL